jgi:hypothetical protein
MGASQSIASASSEQLKEVGPFPLRSSEKSAINVLTEIVDNLLARNNLFDLNDLLSEPERCKRLFIVVSTTVKKEFQLLKFPDPRNPSQMATLSFVPKYGYPPKLADSVAARERACSEITQFLIRLVTLAAACTASIARNENIAVNFPQSIEAGPASTDPQRLINSLPKDINFGGAAIGPEELKFLENVFKPVSAGETTIYRFGNITKYLVDVKRGVVYDARSESTPVFRIRFELFTAKNKVGEMIRPSYGAPYVGYGVPGVLGAGPGIPAMVPGVPGMGPGVPGMGPGVPGMGSGVPGMGPGVPGGMQGAPGAAAPVAPLPAGPVSGPVVKRNNNNDNDNNNGRTVQTSAVSRGPNPYGARSTVTSRPGAPVSMFSGMGGRRTRSHRRGQPLRRRETRRRIRKQLGGADTQYIRCIVTEATYGSFNECENPSRCAETRFYIDTEGNMFDDKGFESYQQNPSSGIQVSTQEFGVRMEAFFPTILRHKIATVPFKEKTGLARDQFDKISGFSSETYTTLSEYRDTIKTLPTGAAPAPYRGFILASRLAGKDLETYFCKDIWAGNPVVGTVSYSLLQALYEDGTMGGTSTPRSLDACRAMANKFIGAQVAYDAAQTGSDVESLRNINFAPIPDALGAFCKTRSPQTTDAERDKVVLIGAQRAIRNLYDSHIADMVTIMKDIMYIRTNPADHKVMMFNLNDRFFEDPAGGLVALEKIIEKARVQIGNHFLEVEKLYAGALRQLGRHVRGTSIINDPTLTVLNKASTALEPT